MKNKLCNLLKEDSIWIMYSAESSEEFFSKYISKSTTAPALAIISREKVYVLVHELDSNNVSDENMQKITYYKGSDFYTSIKNCIGDLKFPKEIFLNYSTQNDTATDVLGHGAYTYLYNIINKIYSEAEKNFSINSAEKFIYELEQINDEEQIKAMEYAAKRALEILEEAFAKIEVGMSEKDVSNLVHNIFNKKPDYFEEIGVIKEEYSWEKENCPIVLIGENLKSGGHSKPSDLKLERGNTIYFDFGVKLTFANGKVASSDIQRTGYVLKEEEEDAPKEIKEPFETLVNAITLGINEMKPGVKGYEIDDIVRSHIQYKSYPDYNHGTGHPVKEIAHAMGTSISPKSEKSFKSSMELKETGVYTIEPRIPIENGCSIEEMVLVTKNGGRPLCTRQEKLYLTKCEKHDNM